MNKISLNNLKLKTFTEQDVLDYCQINNINYNDIIYLNLNENELTDITGIKLFKNLKELYLIYNKLTDISVLKDLNNIKELWLYENRIKDISVIKYLTNLEYLDIRGLKLESDQIEYINSCKNLKYLYYKNGFKDMSVLNCLNKNNILKIYE